MKRRLLALGLAATALFTIGAGPADIGAAPADTDGPAELVVPDPDPGIAFPLGACVYLRPVDPDNRYCVIVEDPR